jgi:acyl-coenzyme A thioesterase PaaI-like protein
MENARGLHMHVDLDHERHEASSTIALDRDLQGWDGVAHGGIVSTLMDEVLCYSLVERRPVFTVELAVRYKKAVPLGLPLTVRARRTLVKGRLMQAEGEIVAPDGEVLVTAAGKFLRPRPTGERE